MSSTDDPSPMQWDPQARGGAGGWVEVPGASSAPAPPPVPWHPPDPASTPAPPPGPGTVPGPGPVPGSQPVPGPGGPPRRKAALVAASGLLVVALAGLIVGRQLMGADEAGPAASPPPTVSSTASEAGTGEDAAADGSPDGGPDTAAEQAQAVDTLLDSSAADRQKVVDAVRSVAACDSVPQARRTLEEAADNRDSLVSQLDSLTVDQVDGGSEAVAELRTAWQHSAEADRAFATWASSAEGCTTAAETSGNDAYDSGVSHSGQATEAKQAFIERWNVIAEEYGLTSRSESEI